MSTRRPKPRAGVQKKAETTRSGLAAALDCEAEGGDGGAAGAAYGLGAEYVVDFGAPVPGSSKVFRAWSVAAPGEALVAKVWSKDAAWDGGESAVRDGLASEVHILGLVRALGADSGSICLRAFVEDDAYAALIFPFVAGGDLLELVLRRKTGLSEAEAQPIFAQIAAALARLHGELGVAHLDLKLENVVVGANGDSVTLIDFGFSKQVDTHARRLVLHCGSPSYLSPEMLRKSPLDPFASDIWSLGVVLYTLLTAAFPFTRASGSSSNRSLFRAIKRGDFALPPGISAPAAHLLASMLSVTPSARPTIADILTHPWLSAPHPAPAPISPPPATHATLPPSSLAPSDASDDISVLVHRPAPHHCPPLSSPPPSPSVDIPGAGRPPRRHFAPDLISGSSPRD